MTFGKERVLSNPTDTGSPLRGRFSPPFLPVFDRYFGLAFLKMFGCCLLGVLGLVVLVDNLENFDEFAKFARLHGKGLGEMGWILLQHYAAYAPSLVCQYMVSALPVAAAVIVITQASLNREFTVLRASGVSMQRAVMPLLVLSFTFGLLYTLTRDLYVPTLLRKSFVMNNQLRPADIVPVKVTPMRDGEALHFTEMGHYDGDKGIAYNLRVEVRKSEDFLAGSNRFIEYRARKATLRPLVDVDNPDDVHLNQWNPEEGGTVTTQLANNRFSQPWTQPLPTLVTQAMLERQVLSEMVMTWNDLLRLEDLEIRLEINRRLSEPFVPLAILMVVLPLALRATAAGQHPSYITNAIIGVAGCGTFYVLRNMFFSWGGSEFFSQGILDYIGPFLAAQGAGAVFIVIGGILLYRLES